MAFADGRMFWGYQTGNLLAFGVSALLSGVIAGWLVWIGALRRPLAHTEAEQTTAKWKKQASLLAVALIAVTVLDLYAAHGRFNPTADPKLSPVAEGGIPPAVQFIQAREAELAAAGTVAPWRFTTFNVPGEKTFNANVGMYYGWQDIRGYDSIIPKQSADFMSRIEPQDNELLYNRIAPIYAAQGGDVYARLDNPLLDLLNVKYILTEHAIPNPTWQEVYRDGSIGVYENTEFLPRTFIADEARVAAPSDQPLETTDLHSTVYIESTPPDANALVRASPQVADARSAATRRMRCLST
ncbi:MAG: hypothetical protein IPK16_33165 [Anaerolineales bacterium]|nr:hypothetical protein [Anaerolineales bacterium]